jgi:hypothetical protein
MADRECPLSAEHFKHFNDRKWPNSPGGALRDASVNNGALS